MDFPNKDADFTTEKEILKSSKENKHCTQDRHDVIPFRHLGCVLVG